MKRTSHIDIGQAIHDNPIYIYIYIYAVLNVLYYSIEGQKLIYIIYICYIFYLQN